MPLINRLNDTKLKSLQWGNDRPNGGNSNQPYIKVDINKLDSLGDQIRFARFDEGLIRGGALTATQAAITDTIRIGKFLKDFPKGPLFLTKQVGLQLSNPKLQVGTVKPLSGNSSFVNLINSGINILNKNSIGPTRIYNLGINTLAQIPLNSIGGHIERHGLTPLKDPGNTYENVIKSQSSSDNRLVQLQAKLLPTQKQLNDNISIQDILDGNFIDKALKITKNSLIIDDYIGGPNSVYGIGHTTIKRYVNTNIPQSVQDAQKAKTRDIITRMTYDGKFVLNQFGLTNQYNLPKQTSLINNTSVTYSTPSAKRFSDLQKQLNNQSTKNTGYLRGKKIENLGPPVKTDNHKVTGWTTKYQYYNLENRLGLPRGVQDIINLTPLFESNKSTPGQIRIPGTTIGWRDMIKFRLEALDSDDPSKSIWMIFRAYLKNITDTPSPTHTDVKYIGRGEKFYTYENFSRTISFNFKVAALSAAEMEPMYQKMNFLYSNTAPDYSNQFLVRSPLMKLTIGNYVYRELGFISSLQYSINDDTPWEIAIDEPEGGKLMYELPHIMDINMTFTCIHNFLPQKSVSDAPFILNKPAEPVGSTTTAGTSATAANIDNPWLKQKENGKYTNIPLQVKK